MAHPDFVKVQLPSSRQKFHIVNQLLMFDFAVEQRGNLRVIQVNFLFSRTAFAVDTGEKQKLALFTIINTLKIFAAANGVVLCGYRP